MVVREVGVAFLKFSTLLYGHENGSSVFEFCAFAQVVIALTGRELVYFEMDPSGQLNEYTERKEMGADIICMALGPVTTTDQRSRFLAVGLADNTVRIISLDPSVSSNRLLCHSWLCSAQILLVQIRMQQCTVQVQCMCVTFVCARVCACMCSLLQDTLQPLSMQALPAAAESLSILQLGGSSDGQEAVGGNPMGTFFLNVGLQVRERERKREGEREREWRESERVRESEGERVCTRERERE